MLINQLFEAYGAAAGVETIRQLIHAVKDGKDIDLKVGPEMTPITYPEARYLLGFFKANRHLGDGVAKYFGDPNWVIGKLEKRDAIQSPDRLNKFDIERMKDVQKDKVLDLEEIHVDHDDQRNNKKRMAEEAYKGWKYETDIEEFDDNRKISHTAKKGDQEVSIDWSPYNYMSDEEFKTWVDLDMPGRKDVNSIGPLHPEDLEQLMKTKLGTRARLAQEGKPTDIELDVLKYTDEQVAKAITIARGSDGDMTGATDRIEAIADGLSNHSDVAKVLKIANEAKDDDITKKLDPKTKIALKKAQMKSAGLTKGDPIASLAYGLEKDVDRLDKENDQEEADIASQELVDKYHSQELEQLKKMLDSILKK
jgi:hypothetical protein